MGADLTLLRRGAKPGELAELERALGQAIHPSVRAALLRHDGSRDLLGESIEWQLLNAREVCEMRRDWGTAAPTGWWPLAANEPRLLCVDGRGCVMEVDVDFEERPRAIAASVAAWLTAIAPPPRVRPDDGLVPLIEQLVADGELELAEGASLDQLADAIRERMTDGDDAKQRATLALAALIRSALVEEVYLDEAALARRLAALT
ncbi:MAG: SMI1/KNR4 family protein [Myxococcales bacterium]|nr:SMI1/KNR4 family protein [Myxococcales bacterium]